MQIVLYSFSKRENSTKRPDSGTTVNGNLRADSGILSPAIEFTTGNPAAYNYAYIPDWGRYYWITEWTYTGGLWLANMRVDPLASWRDEIGASTQYVLRSSANCNGKVSDNYYPVTAQARFDTQGVWLWPQNTYSFVVATIGGGPYGCVTYYAMSATAFAAFSAYLFNSANFTTDIGDMAVGVFEAQFNPFQYIVGVTMFPFDATKYGGEVAEINVGWWSIPSQGFVLNNPLTVQGGQWVNIPQHPQAARGSYLNSAPYTAIECSHPLFGRFSLPPEIISATGRFYVALLVDMFTGAAELRFSPDNDSVNAFAVSAGVVGAPVQVAQIKINALDVGTSIASTVAGAIGGGALGALGAVASVGNVLDALTPKMQTKGANGSRAGFFYPLAVHTTHYIVVDEDNEDRGRPLCEKAQISSLPGFLMVADGDISLPATAEENSTIKSYMEGGFFFE